MNKPRSFNESHQPSLGDGFAILIAIALVALIVGGLAFTQGREAEKRVNSIPTYVEQAKKVAAENCRLADTNTEFDCIYETLQSGVQQAQFEQDLDAQQGMKFWAAVMAWLTAFTVAITAVGVWFVKRTLDATLEAVRDTRDATTAMIRQNELTEATQRAWIDIDLSVRTLEVTKGSLSLDYEVIFTNMGKTIAQSVWFKVDSIVAAEEYRKLAQAKREYWSTPQGPSHIALMPGEKQSHLSVVNWTVREMPWPRGDRPKLNLVIVAQAMYLPEGKSLSSDRAETFRAFRIGIEGENTIQELLIDKACLEYSGKLEPIVRKTGPTFTS